MEGISHLKTALFISVFFAAMVSSFVQSGSIYGDVYDGITMTSSTQATNPNPADGAVIIGDIYGSNIWTRLVFYPGSTAVKHTAYFSDDYEDVTNRIEDANLGEPPFGDVPGWEYIYLVGNPAVGPADETLVRETVYYWCIDETDADGNTFLGEIWRFGLMGNKAFAPNPPNEGIIEETDVLLSWWPGSVVDEHDVYIGTDFNDVNNALYDYYNPPPEFKGTVSELNIFIANLAFATKYYWRVDEIFGRTPPPNPNGVYYKGDVWCFTTVPGPIHVDIDATGLNNGKSWTDAYNFLQDALAEANDSEKPVKILVAQGIYKPDQGDGQTVGDRTATFQLINGAMITGGYAGFGEPNPNERDIDIYRTVLSGDLGDNDANVNDPCDLLTEPTRGENSYHVVFSSDCNQTAILDGFTISGGNANGLYEYSSGGGMYNNQSSPTLTNCVFMGNSASRDGGGIRCSGEPMCSYLLGDLNQDCGVDWKDLQTFTWQWLEPECLVPGCIADLDGIGGVNMSDLALLASNWSGGRKYLAKESRPTLTDCTFSMNSAGHDGGGAQCDLDTHVTFSNCAFRGNLSVNGEGGAINLDVPSTKATLTDCFFVKNTALQGGALQCDHCNIRVNNCGFIGNIATEHAGGAICFEMENKEERETPKIRNSVFAGNSSFSRGGAIYNELNNFNMSNCLFYDNRAILGGAIWNETGWSGPSLVTINNCTFKSNAASDAGGGVYCELEYDSIVHIRNCILWEDTPQEVYVDSGTPAITYSDVQGGWPGDGNIDAAPCFVDSNDPDGADDKFLTGDDGLQLTGWRTSFSPCIDAGNNTIVTEHYDIIGKSRIVDGDGNTTATVDMGAYEFIDTDDDGMPDWWEVTYDLDANSAIGSEGADGDRDSDGWRNIVEYFLRTEPNNSSSDGEDRLPIGWNTMEIEAKWIISESTFNSVQSDFSEGSTYGINGTSYQMSWKWGGDQKLYWDFYYDNSGDVLSNGLHCLRKRRRLSSPYNDPSDRDFQRVQYKSDPYRFGAVWMRQEYRDDDLNDAEATNIVVGDSTTWDINPESYNTVDAVLVDHPGFDESTLDDFLQVVDYRYKIDFEKNNTDYFTMSLDNATSTYSGGNSEQFYELELELIPMPHTAGQVEELFRILVDLEADYTLIPSTSSKGGLEVPESF